MLQGNAGDRNIPGYVFNRGIKDKPGILPSLIKSASNAFVATNTPNHPFPPEAEMGGFLLVEAQSQSPETQDKSCGHAINNR